MDITEQFHALGNTVQTLFNRNAILKTVVKDLLEQHERQLHMDDCSLRGDACYLRKLPEWERAWDNAYKVLYGGD